jgi:Sigma 54 modulation/S30EA ribosomal protein C terminus
VPAGLASATENGQVAADPGLEPSLSGLYLPQPRPGADDVIPIQMEGDGPVVVREKFHAAMPMSIDQALLEMELVGHDFYLFRDDACGHPSVVYRRHGYQYGLIRLVEPVGADAASPPGRR